MQYKDYYKTLGVSREATGDEIKKAYRKLAHKYHPDISQDPEGEEKFKEVNEAYKTLKDPELRKAYDELGTHRSGENFQPSSDWASHFGEAGGGGFEGVDLSDLFEAMARGRTGSARGFSGTQWTGGGQASDFPLPGQDFEVAASLTLEQAAEGVLLNLNLEMPEYDEQGRLRRTPRAFKARIPKGVVDGQKLRLPGKGGKGWRGGQNGDLYLTMTLLPHPLFRSSQHDLYLDLPVTPWEAALGATIEVPTLAGPVSLKIPPGTPAGRKMRITGKGLPKPRDGQGDLFVLIQIVNPSHLSDREQALYRELSECSAFNPRAHLAKQA